MMKKFNKNSLNIISYHYVREIKNSKYPNINGIEYSLFKKQISFFKRNFNIVSPDDLNDLLDNKKKYKLNKPLLALTFDDGYKDHYKYVFPTLVKEKIRGFFYPPVNIFKGDVLNVNKLQHILCVAKNKKKLLKEILNLLKDFKIHFKLNSEKKLHNKKIPEYDDKNTLLIKRLIYKELSENMHFRQV